LQHDLNVLGYYTGRLNGHWDAPSRAAFARFIGEHNFENKQTHPEAVWPTVRAYLKERADAEVARRTTTAPIVPDALSKGPGAQPKGGAPSSNRSKRFPASK
ncbi:MAG: hypothetical protein L3K02_08485, partial [Thermoplasmata archaeon]|nr:hypothetical protein [Thermoplasmata archaeon]